MEEALEFRVKLLFCLLSSVNSIMMVISITFTTTNIELRPVRQPIPHLIEGCHVLLSFHGTDLPEAHSASNYCSDDCNGNPRAFSLLIH